MSKSLDLYAYKAQLDRVVDGDTVDAMIDLGFGVWVKKRIRFMGVDTWESRTRNKAEKKRGLKAKAYTKDMLEADKGCLRLSLMEWANTAEYWEKSSLRAIKTL